MRINHTALFEALLDDGDIMTVMNKSITTLFLWGGAWVYGRYVRYGKWVFIPDEKEEEKK